MRFSSDSQRKACFARFNGLNKFSASDRMRSTKDLVAEQKELLYKVNNMPLEHSREDVSNLVHRLDRLDHVLNQRNDRMSSGSLGVGDRLANAVVGLYPESHNDAVLSEEYEEPDDAYVAVNSFANYPDYMTGEGMTTEEMRSVRTAIKEGYDPNKIGEDIARIEDMRNRKDIVASGLNALAEIPSYMGDIPGAAAAASSVINPYVKQERLNLAEDIAAQAEMPFYQRVVANSIEVQRNTAIKNQQDAIRQQIEDQNLKYDTRRKGMQDILYREQIKKEFGFDPYGKTVNVKR